MKTALPRILCVDDDERLLAGVSRNLRRHYQVLTAVGGQQALDLLKRDRDFVVIISDMRMPGMTGAEFLGRAQLLVPDAVRILLTGQADLAAVISAVNDGRIFRYVAKPIEKDDLIRVVGAAIAQYQLQRDREDATADALRGAVELAAQVLSLVSLERWGVAQRARAIASGVAHRLGLSDVISLEGAAVLTVIARHADTDAEVFGADVPALDAARALVVQVLGVGPKTVGAQVVAAALAVDAALRSPSTDAPVTVDAVLDHVGRVYDARIVEALRAELTMPSTPIFVPVGSLAPGMRLTSPLLKQDGTVAIPVGVPLTAFILRRFALGDVEVEAEVAAETLPDVDVIEDVDETVAAAE